MQIKLRRLFQLNSKNYIGIPMVPGVSFVSSMKILTHRQQYISDRDTPSDTPTIDDPGWQARIRARARSRVPPETTYTTPGRPQYKTFINVCLYTNCRFCTHSKTSMNRSIDSSE